jgi:hypothetical protein
MELTLPIASPPVVVVHVTSGPGWLALALTLLGTFLAGTATALLIQLYVVPRVETRKRREERWERDVRELHEVLAARLTSLANQAFIAQFVYRHVRDEKTDEYSPAAVSHQSREAREATWAYGGLIGAQIDLLMDRVLSINPNAPELAKLKRVNRNFQQKAIFVQPLPGDDTRTDEEFHKTWEKENDARKALTEQVKVLAHMRHPPGS